MSTRSLRARVRTFLDEAGTCGLLGGGGRTTRPLGAAAMAGVALLAAVALALVAACGGPAATTSGSVSVLLSRTSLPSGGGAIVVTEEAPGASDCAVSVDLDEGLELHRVTLRLSPSCGSGGRFLVTVDVPADGSFAAEQYSVLATASYGPRLSARFAYVTEASRHQASGTSLVPAAATGVNPLTALPPRAGPAASFLLSTLSVPLSGGAVTLSYAAPGASSCQLYSGLAAFLGEPDPESVNCEGSQTLDIPRSSRPGLWTLTFSATAADGTTTSVSRSLEQSNGFSPSIWAGYVIQPGQDVDGVGGKWTVPRLECQQTPNAIVGAWAGIGGAAAGTGDLLQTGVADQCVGGFQVDQAWWELAPTYNAVYFSGLPVFPGDQMQASVYFDPSSGQWVTRIDNLTSRVSGWMTTGGTYGVGPDWSGSYTPEGSASNISYAGGRTAEWAVEAPGLTDPGASFSPIPDFGTVQFSDLLVGLQSPQSLSLNPDEGQEIVYHNQAVAAPGLPGGDGFSVSYLPTTYSP